MITIKPIESKDLPGLNQLYHELMGTSPDDRQKNEQRDAEDVSAYGEAGALLCAWSL